MYSSHGYPYSYNQAPHQQSSPSPVVMPSPQPPPRMSYPHPASPYPSHPPTTTVTSSSPAASMPTLGAATVGGRTPDKGPSEFPLLGLLSVDELQRLLECEDKLNDLVNDGNKKQRQVDKEMAMAENRSLADFNMSRETRLREGRLQLARLHEEAKRSRDVYDVNRRQMESLNENFSLDAAKVMLETAASKTEEESEEIAEEFMNGNLPLTDFVEQFNQRRMLAHIRRIKSDKMQELLKSTPHSAAHPPDRVDIPMAMPMGHSPSHMRQAPALPPRPGSHGHVYHPVYPSAQANTAPVPAHGGSSVWTPYSGAVPMPTLPSYPR